MPKAMVSSLAPVEPLEAELYQSHGSHSFNSLFLRPLESVEEGPNDSDFAGTLIHILSCCADGIGRSEKKGIFTDAWPAKLQNFTSSKPAAAAALTRLVGNRLRIGNRQAILSLRAFGATRVAYSVLWALRGRVEPYKPASQSEGVEMNIGTEVGSKEGQSQTMTNESHGHILPAARSKASGPPGPIASDHQHKMQCP
ncbi:hypothetical protein AXG93_4409s1000 [Marchantia polymorpha subsp. ruderalis]|uniref:Uncharacterized protein n=1 Tax=Marchantia polymorpha subsp. ruderalis TaxID=1480154 RepID=A0A176WRU9_MARPO|nr:hypothetical protein AXG93_4409s1000 [Marchantia polymorpha subsp. ruderalis]